MKLKTFFALLAIICLNNISINAGNELYQAIHENDKNTVLALLQINSHVPHYVDGPQDAPSPLESAIMHQNIEIAQILLNHGANINKINPLSNTSILYDIVIWVVNEVFTDTHMIEFMLKHGADPNLGDIKPLGAIARGNTSNDLLTTSLINVLLNYGANPYLEDKYGETAMKIAKYHNNTIFIKAFHDWKKEHNGKIIYKISQQKLPQNISFKFQ